MRKWLRSRFAWRFSLARLVVAVVFLGAFVGLNMRKIGPMAEVGPQWGPLCSYWGWPLPFYSEWDERWVYAVSTRYDWRPSWDQLTEDEAKSLEKELGARSTTAKSYRLPLTHQAYRLLDRDLLFKVNVAGSGFISYAIIDILVLLVPFVLILFFHPRRKPEPEGAK